MAQNRNAEKEILRYVQQSEYRRESARLMADKVSEQASSTALVEDGDEEAEALLAALALAIGRLLAETAKDAAEHAHRMGIKPRLTERQALAAARQAMEAVLAEASKLVADRVGELERRAVRMAEGAAPEAAAAALGGTRGNDAAITLLRALLRQTAAGVVARTEQEIQKAALFGGTAGLKYMWQTREDGKECSDVYANSCLPRNGEIRPLEADRKAMERPSEGSGYVQGWKDLGLPGAPNLLCSLYARGDFSHCRCMLLPQRWSYQIEEIPSGRFKTASEAGRAAARRRWEKAA